MFGNLRVFWKLALVALLIPVTVLVVGGIALSATDSLKYQIDNMYGSMLVPIMNLGQADIAEQGIYVDLEKSNQLFVAASVHEALAKDLRVRDDEMQGVITKYEAEWLTTKNPSISAMLAAQGKKSLQADEAAALKQYHEAYAAYAPQRDALLATTGWGTGLKVPAEQLDQMHAALQQLAAIDKQYAELSNKSAQSQIVQLRSTLVTAGVLVTLLALVAAMWIARSITQPLTKTVRMIQEMGQGHLSMRLGMQRRDEIGIMSGAMDRFADHLQETVVGTMQRIAAGDLSVDVVAQD